MNLQYKIKKLQNARLLKTVTNKICKKKNNEKLDYTKLWLNTHSINSTNRSTEKHKPN